VAYGQFSDSRCFCVKGLSGEVSTPVSVLHKLLDALYDTFRFFHSSIDSFQQVGDNASTHCV